MVEREGMPSGSAVGVVGTIMVVSIMLALALLLVSTFFAQIDTGNFTVADNATLADVRGYVNTGIGLTALVLIVLPIALLVGVVLALARG